MQAPQTCVVPLQIGFDPEQSALLRQLTQVPVPAHALVRMGSDGLATVVTGVQDIGTGVSTTFAVSGKMCRRKR